MQYVEASSNGGIKRIARITSEPVPTTDAAIADFRSSYLAMLDRETAEGLRDRIAQSLDEAEYYPTLPATSNIKIDSEGNVWLAHYAFRGSLPDRWEIFDTDGRWQGTVATPPGLEIHAIGESQVLGLFTDELGVAYLRIHEIVKP